MKNAIAIRHVAFEDAGTLEPVLKERGIALTISKPASTISPPPRTPISCSCSAARSASTRSTAIPSSSTSCVIEAAVKKGVPVIGICLGCQALAAVLAARVYPNRAKELGWDQMTLTEEGKASPLGVIDGVPC